MDLRNADFSSVEEFGGTLEQTYAFMFTGHNANLRVIVKDETQQNILLNTDKPIGLTINNIEIVSDSTVPCTTAA